MKPDRDLTATTLGELLAEGRVTSWVASDRHLYCETDQGKAIVVCLLTAYTVEPRTEDPTSIRRDLTTIEQALGVGSMED